MDQQYLDNLLKRIESLSDSISNLASNMANPKPEKSNSVITSENQDKPDQQKKEDEDAAEIMVKRFRKEFAADNAKEEKDSKEINNKVLGYLSDIADTSDDMQKMQEIQQQNDDIKNLRQPEDTRLYIVGMDRSVIDALTKSFGVAALGGKEAPKNESGIGSLLAALGIGGAIGAFSMGPGVGGDIGRLVFLIANAMRKAVTTVISKMLPHLSIANILKFDKLQSMASWVGTKLKAAGEYIISSAWKLLKGVGNAISDNIAKILGPRTAAILESGSKLFTGGGFIAKLLPKLGSIISTLFKGGLKALKFIPGIGNLINLYFAYSRFKEGDYIGAAIELAGVIPGLNIITAVISLARDLMTTEESRVAQSAPIGNFFGEIGDWFARSFNSIKKWNIYKGSMKIIDGAKQFASGDILGGLAMLSKGFLQISPAGMIFFLITDAYTWISSWFDGGESTEAASEPFKFTLPSFDIIKTIKDAMTVKLQRIRDFALGAINKVKEFTESTWKTISGVFSDSSDAASVAAGAPAGTNTGGGRIPIVKTLAIENLNAAPITQTSQLSDSLRDTMLSIARGEEVLMKEQNKILKESAALLAQIKDKLLSPTYVGRKQSGADVEEGNMELISKFAQRYSQIQATAGAL